LVIDNKELWNFRSHVLLLLGTKVP